MVLRSAYAVSGTKPWYGTTRLARSAGASLVDLLEGLEGSEDRLRGEVPASYLDGPMRLL
eukprot:1284128-Rhodomonas_salina.2